jgi:alkylhydroperoxidase family enzyme
MCSTEPPGASDIETVASPESIRFPKHLEVPVPRLEPLADPDPAAADLLRRMMPGDAPPIALFRLLVRNLPLAEAAHAVGRHQLSRSLSLGVRDREILVDRTTARCGADYELGVHLAIYADRAGLTPAQVTSLTSGASTDACWTDERDRVLLDAADALHDGDDVDDALWERLTAHLDTAQVLDLVVLCGFYHAVSWLTRVARLDPEPFATLP